MSPEPYPPLKFDEFSNIVDGKLVRTTRTRHAVNPSTLAANPEVPASTQRDVDGAVIAAREAFDAWSRKPIEERRQAILDLSESLEELKDDFARLLTLEQGKPLVAARSEVDAAIHWLRAQAKLEFPTEEVENSEHQRISTVYSPLGVAVAIVPWNFPLMIAAGKVAPALLTGNCLILKPSPFTPYCGLKLAELAQRHFPPGVFQALSGGDDLGPMLTEHPGIDKVSFTGSTATGRRVMESCSRTLKRVTLELGGNDPAIVCDDVDLETVVPQIAQFVWENSGQVCVAIKRLYVHNSIYPRFLEAFVEATRGLTVGDGFGDNHLGPVQNELQYLRVRKFLEDIRDTHCKVAAGLENYETQNKPGPGYFVRPTIVDNPPDNSMIVKEEPFGPIIPILTWSSEEDVIRRANDTEYGLGASVWTNNKDRASRMARKLKAGSIWVNSHMLLNPAATFGGHKQSGIGAEWGVQGLKAYCNTQTFFWTKAASLL